MNLNKSIQWNSIPEAPKEVQQEYNDWLDECLQKQFNQINNPKKENNLCQY